MAGKQKGLFNEDGSQTRSGLFFEALRIIEETKPRVAIAENVKNLTSKKFEKQFKIVLDSLEAAGYNNYWKVLNAKDFGVPQNRERVFIVSIRKDIDTGCFQFPEGFPLENRLIDLCETEVDESFFLSEKIIKKISTSSFAQEATRIQNDDICQTLLARDYKDPKCIQIANLNHYQNDQMNRVYSTEGISPTLITKSGGGREIKILVREATKCGFSEAEVGDSINLEQPNSKTRRGRVGKQVAQTITTSPQQATVTKSHDVRKLIPKEYFRLMDFEDSDFEKAEAVNSNTQLYKQAGNSIVVAVPYYIIKALFEANILIEKEKKQMELKMNEYQLPEKISFNFEELKQELTEKVSHYETLVYTDEQIQEAKKDKANLNKLKKALNDERIRREKEYMVPFNAFKSQVNEIIAIIDKPVAVIDKQVKSYEEQKKKDKLDEITNFFNSTDHPDWLHLSQIMDDKWLNASVSMKSVQEAIDSRLEQITNDLSTLHDLPEFGFEAKQVYISSLDINKAISEGHRLSEIAKKKAEYEATQAAKIAEQMAEAEFAKNMNPPAEEAPAKQWIAFQALLTVEQAKELKSFFESRNIEFKAV